MLEVAEDLIETINDFWYDPYVLNKKDNTTDHVTVNVDQGHHNVDHHNITGHEQNNTAGANNSTQNATIDYNEDYYNGTNTNATSAKAGNDT